MDSGIHQASENKDAERRPMISDGCLSSRSTRHSADGCRQNNKGEPDPCSHEHGEPHRSGRRGSLHAVSGMRQCGHQKHQLMPGALPIFALISLVRVIPEFFSTEETNRFELPV